MSALVDQASKEVLEAVEGCPARLDPPSDVAIGLDHGDSLTQVDEAFHELDPLAFDVERSWLSVGHSFSLARVDLESHSLEALLQLFQHDLKLSAVMRDDNDVISESKVRQSSAVHVDALGRPFLA